MTFFKRSLFVVKLTTGDLECIILSQRGHRESSTEKQDQRIGR